MYIYMFLYIYMYICIRRCTVDPRKLEHGFRRLCARIPNILYLKGMRILMFQLSGFYYKSNVLGSSREPWRGQDSGYKFCRVQGLRVWGLIRVYRVFSQAKRHGLPGAFFCVQGSRSILSMSLGLTGLRVWGLLGLPHMQHPNVSRTAWLWPAQKTSLIAIPLTYMGVSEQREP